MVIELSTPRIEAPAEVLEALRDWQDDAAPMQLHPGDLGWFGRFGAAATAAALRVWTRDGRIVAVGFLDGPDLLRLTVAPSSRQDAPLADRIVADLADPAHGVLPTGRAAVETPNGTLVQARLTQSGWDTGESWTPLRRDLTAPVDRPARRIDVVGPEQAAAFTATHRAAWDSPSFTLERWRTMMQGPLSADVRCLLGYDERGVAVGALAVWSAGPGRPGLIEPLGVLPDQRGQGHGRAICVAAAAVLQELGSSSVLVCTESTRVAAIATYESAGFERLPPRRDRIRAA
nr:GNAT family N-acetyltransferase [Microbacterium bovistercoris]